MRSACATIGMSVGPTLILGVTADPRPRSVFVSAASELAIAAARSESPSAQSGSRRPFPLDQYARLKQVTVAPSVGHSPARRSAIAGY